MTFSDGLPYCGKRSLLGRSGHGVATANRSFVTHMRHQHPNFLL